MNKGKPMKRYIRGRKELSQHDVYELNRLHWVAGVSAKGLLTVSQHGETVIGRYLFHTWGDWQRFKRQYEELYGIDHNSATK